MSTTMTTTTMPAGMHAAPHHDVACGGGGVAVAVPAATSPCSADAACGVLAYDDLKSVALCPAAAAATTTKGSSGAHGRHGKDAQQHQQPQQTKEQMQLVVVDDAAPRMRNVLMPFAGFYEDVTYPVATLYCPPQPPSALPPRARMPPRRQRAAAPRDLTHAGPRENDAQCVVSKVWRGVLSRRQLRNDRTYQHILHTRARMIQCWWRTLCARRERASRAAIKQQWLDKRAGDYLADRLAGMSNMMKWQQRRYDAAARVLQRTVRWWLRRRACARWAQRGVPASEWPLQPLPFPLPRHATVYFPWRHRRHHRDATEAATTKQVSIVAVVDAGNGNGSSHQQQHEDDGHGKPAQRRRTLLTFKKTRNEGSLDGGSADGEDAPVRLDVVERVNATMRRRTRDRNASLCDPAAVQRRSWKRDNLQRHDFDFNAGVIQRAFRARRATVQLVTREATTTYMNKVVGTLVRAFRLHALVQRMQERRSYARRCVREAQLRYTRDRIAHVNHALVWGKELMACCAMTIQRCWRWYHYTRLGHPLPPHLRAHTPARHDSDGDSGVIVAQAYEDDDNNDEDDNKDDDEQVADDSTTTTLLPPPPPPYGMLREHIARERELRLSRMTLQERNLASMRQRRTCAHFTPAQTIMRKRLGLYLTPAASPPQVTA